MHVTRGRAGQWIRVSLLTMACVLGYIVSTPKADACQACVKLSGINTCVQIAHDGYIDCSISEGFCFLGFRCF